MNKKSLILFYLTFGMVSCIATSEVNASNKRPKKLDSYSGLIVSQYLESKEDNANFVQINSKFEQTFEKLHYNPRSINPSELKFFPNIETLHLYTLEDLKNWETYEVDTALIDSIPSGNLKNAKGLFNKVVIHVPIEFENTANAAVLERVKNIFISPTSKAKYQIKFLNVKVQRAEQIGHVNDKTGEFIFNDCVYTGYNKNNEKITVESCDCAYVIRNIPDGCFQRLDSLKSIIIPDSVYSIGDSAFKGCINLENIYIPNSVSDIGICAFNDCAKVNKIEIPYGVKRIANMLFCGCTGLSEIIIPNGITSIGIFAFDGCRGLKSITLSDSITSIGSSAFKGCDNAQFIVPHKQMQKYLNDVHKIDIDKMHVTDSSKTSWAWQPIDGCIKVPDYIDKIDDKMFAYRNDIISIEMPDTVKSIGQNPFFGCNNLQSIKLPNTLTSIGDYAFTALKSLESIEIPNSVTSIGREAFYGCSGLESITIPNGVTTIDRDAFGGCAGLRSITLPDSIISFGYSIFDGYYGTQVEVPNEAMKKYILSYNCRLNCIVNPALATNENSWKWPDDGRMIVPNSINKIYHYMFLGRDDITHITLPDSVMSIEYNAFIFCDELKSVTIPSTIQYIHKYVFDYCRKLENVYVRCNGEITVDEKNRILQLLDDSTKEKVKFIDNDGKAI